MKKRLQDLGRRWPWLGRALAVQERFGEVNGSFVSAGITVSIFTSVFPLLLVAIAVVGFIASGDDGWATRFVDDLGLTGSAKETVTNAIAKASQSKNMASIVGVVGLAWSGSGVGVALQRGVRTPWQERSVGMADRAKAFGWLISAGVGFAAVIALTSALNWLPDAIPVVVAFAVTVVVGLAVEVGLFWWMFWGLGTRRVPARDLLPGAIFAAVGFEVLKLVGALYVPRLVAKSSSLYGPLGIVFALLAWLALFARLLVYASTLNAVRYEAREGTDTVPLLVPRLPDGDVVGATRAGLMLGPDDPPPAVPDPEPDTVAQDQAAARALQT